MYMLKYVQSSCGSLDPQFVALMGKISLISRIEYETIHE